MDSLRKFIAANISSQFHTPHIRGSKSSWKIPGCQPCSRTKRVSCEPSAGESFSLCKPGGGQDSRRRKTGGKTGVDCKPKSLQTI